MFKKNKITESMDMKPKTNTIIINQGWSHAGNIGNIPNKIYRFFDNENFANDFVKGNMRISTLGVCRANENKAQGDSKEGTMTYHINYISSEEKNSEQILKRAGYRMKGCVDCYVIDSFGEQEQKDSYILCTTMKFNPEDFKQDFGSYCIEITNPKKLMEIITRTLHKTKGITMCNYGRVVYKNRLTFQNECLEVPIELIKPDTDIYKMQNEFRFTWYTAESNISPIDIKCGDISDICKRIK
ncbi:hypothetical protein [Pantoea sp. App145]|uniref:hypothetical protein n=1 Tax=Pantoea sp. App145 TaxID=3071567 RepID=UPI003A7F7085